MLAGDHLADADVAIDDDGVHRQIEQQVLLLSRIGYAAVHVGFYLLLCAGPLPKAELVQPGAPELVGARVAELEASERSQAGIGRRGDGPLAHAAHVGCHLVLVDDDGYVCPLACPEDVAEDHTVA